MGIPRHVSSLVLSSTFALAVYGGGAWAQENPERQAGDQASDEQSVPNLTTAQKTAIRWIDGSREDYTKLGRYIWRNPELSLDEFKSSAKLIGYLKDNDFEVQSGVGDLDTAFIATWGSGGPTIGFLAEYDALPGLSQTAGEFDHAPLTKGAPGHGCHHHLYGTSSVTAAIATAKALEENGIDGTVKLYGTPAEETLMGKVFMASEGVFSDLDAVISWHPSDRNGTGNTSGLAMNSVKFHFQGTPAHAAGAPEEGRSALDAAELLSVGVQYMREHVTEDARIHAVITEGGDAPNVVPPDATAWYYVRAPRRSQVDEIYAWMKQIASGAAEMTQTEESHDLLAATYEPLPNKTLAQVGYQVASKVGPPPFNQQDAAFGRRVLKALSKEEFEGTPYSRDVTGPDMDKRFPDIPVGNYSTDQGNVSWIVPTVSFSAATYVKGTPGHSWPKTAQGINEAAMKGGLTAAKYMAGTAVRIFRNPQLLADAENEFQTYVAEFGEYQDPVADIPTPDFETLYGFKRDAIAGRESGKMHKYGYDVDAGG